MVFPRPIATTEFDLGYSLYFAEESDARAARREKIDKGKRVSLIAYNPAFQGYGFDIFD